MTKAAFWTKAQSLVLLCPFSCCQSDGRGENQKLPIICFDQNGCHGLWWLGQEACSEEIVNNVADEINKSNNFTIPLIKVVQRGTEFVFDIEDFS